MLSLSLQHKGGAGVQVEGAGQSLYRAASMQSCGSYSATPSLPHSTSLSGGADPRNKVVWTEQEDALLRDLIARYGTSRWSLIASKIPVKTNKHCRRRWQACVNATGNKGAWSQEEDDKLIQGHEMFGNRWTEIAKLVPGRTDNAAKNRFGVITRVHQHADAAGSKRSGASPAPASASDSGIIGEESEASLGDDHESRPVGHKRRRSQEDKLGGASTKLHLSLDLNTLQHAAGLSNADSEGSAVVQAEEGGAESVRTSQPGLARPWLDLNVPCEDA